MFSQLSTTFRSIVNQFRHRLADIDALPQLTLIGIIVGFLAGGLIILFRWIVDTTLNNILPNHTEHFEGLSYTLRFLLPLTGAIIIGLCLHKINSQYRDISIGNVLERFHNFQGRMSLGNMLVQFWGAILCLISGQSVGREGPAVHIGASAASLLGQRLRLPNNSLRTLIGCGVAAAISASFDTPIAGVIFAMEVVLMGYNITSFIPIMMSSVCGVIVTRVTLGSEIFFTTTDFHMHGLWELPIMVVAGLIIGLLATIYMRLQLGLHRFSHYPILWRVIAAGFVTGFIALWVPEILGLGYDTVNLALEGKLALTTLIIILIAKIISTSVSISMGMPGGLIGPQLFIGACIGAIIGNVVNVIFPDSVSSSGFYVLLGMAAMMGAVINAPLAALMAVVELTYNPSIIFPSMLIIVVSCITTRQIFKCEGIFIEQLSLNGKSLASSPAQQALNNIGVHSAMKTAFVESGRSISSQAATHLLTTNPLWIVITHNETENTLLRAADLATYITEHINSEETDNNQEETNIDLLEIPGQRFSLLPISELSTLYEAQQMLSKQSVDALLVTSIEYWSNKTVALGIITRSTIDNYYKI